MKVFCSYAFTGEDHNVLRARLLALRDIFEELNLEYYVNQFAPKWQEMVDRGADGGEFMFMALKEIEPCDVMLVIMTSERRSEGMLMEVGAALMAGKKIVLAQHASSVGKTYLNTIANDTIVWHSDEDLLQQVGDYFNAQN